MQSSLLCHERYSLTGANYNYKSEIQVYINQSLPICVKTKCPIKKIIRLANSMLKLNLFQCCLLCWLIKKTHVESKIKQLEGLHLDLEDIQIVEEVHEKQMLLFLLLNGYHVKSSFILNGSEIDIDPLILENVKSFRQIYNEWKPQKPVKNISIIQINSIFESWNNRKGTAITKSKVDYNKIVDKILILSKTYNVCGKQANQEAKDSHTIKEQNQNKNLNKRPEICKKIKPNENDHRKNIVQIRHCEEKQITENQYQSSPMKNSCSNKNQWPWVEDQPNDVLNLRRSQRSINRSIDEMKLEDMNYSMFKSFRSNDSCMLDSFRNTRNAHLFNLNNSLVKSNAHFGTIFKSSLEQDILEVNDQNMKLSKRKIKVGPKFQPTLKQTVSFDELK